MWLILRTESQESFCWWGEGIFDSHVWWGDDMPSVRLKCRDPTGYGTTSTKQAYCSESPIPNLNDLDPENYAKDMCTSTNRANEPKKYQKLKFLGA